MLNSDDVLVVVDMQNIFVDGAGVWEVVGYHDAEQVVEKLRADFPGQVVLTKFVADPKEHGVWKDYYDAYPTTRLEENDEAWNLTIDQNPGDLVVTAPTFSKWGDELAKIVPQNSRIIMVGVATDCCIISTALGAIDAGRQVVIVNDACAGTSVVNHTKAVEVMELLGPMIRVVESKDLLAGN